MEVSSIGPVLRGRDRGWGGVRGAATEGTEGKNRRHCPCPKKDSMWEKIGLTCAGKYISFQLSLISFNLLCQSCQIISMISAPGWGNQSSASFHMGCPQDQPASQGRGWNLTSGLMTPTLLKGKWHAVLTAQLRGLQLAQHEDSFFPSEIIVILHMKGVVILGWQLGETQRRKTTKLHYKLEKEQHIYIPDIAYTVSREYLEHK